MTAFKNLFRISGLRLVSILVECMLFFMQTYLVNVWNLGINHAAGILNTWSGISMILSIFFVFISDTYLGNFRMLVVSSITYTLGISFIAMSTPPVLSNLTSTCRVYESQCVGHTQKVLFYIGMALSATGMAGQFVSAKPFLDEQDLNERISRDEDEPEVGSCIKSLVKMIFIPIIGGIIVAKIKSWSGVFGIAAICTAIATILFLSGSCEYKKAEPKGWCPLTTVFRVLVASACKIFRPLPSDPAMIYKRDGERQSFTRTRLVGYVFVSIGTALVRFLQKAAIILPNEISLDRQGERQVRNRWKLCSVGEIEEAKIVVCLVPMWLTFIVCGIVSSIGNTYFVEQANNMNRKLGKWEVPFPIILMILLWSKFSSEILDMESTLDEVELASDEEDKSDDGLPLGMYFIFSAMVWGILCCITAARIEAKRLRVITKHGLLDKPDEDIPMTVFWLYFQFVLLGTHDIFFKWGVALFFFERSPASIRHYLRFFTMGVYGLGYMCGMLSVYVVGKVTQIGGKKSWFQHTLNNSRLDRYYWFLAAFGSVNLVVSIVVARILYKKRRMHGHPDQ